MSSLLDSLNKLDSKLSDDKTDKPIEDKKVEENKKDLEKSSDEDDLELEENIKKESLSEIKQRVTSKVKDVSSNLDAKKSNKINSSISKFMYDLVMLPLKLIDKNIVVYLLHRGKENKVFYFVYLCDILLSTIICLLINNYSLLIGCVISCILYEIFRRKL